MLFSVLCRAVVLLMAAVVLRADSQPVELANEGKPMRVPFQCAPDDLQALGLDCSQEEPCPVYLELSAAESAGARVLVAGNIHTPNATLSSILLASEDGGKTWREAHPRIRFSVLEQIQFFHFAHGWISGEVIQALPRDPFFLLTDDGGKTWRQRPIFEESRPGAIEQFHFDSPNSGALLIRGANYELYETMTGGESWMARQVSPKPLTLPRSRPPENAMWRLRAGRKNHSYDVEMRSAEGWRAVASFLVEIGSCK